MVNIYCDEINEEIRKVAKRIVESQKTTVKIVALTETLEVVYEKAQENKKMQKQS